MDKSQKAQTEIERLADEIKQKKEERALDTRRKILVGAIVLRKAETEPQLLERLTAWLDESLTEERNRALFPGLPKREPS